ncbi:enolase-phosphatase E1 [Fopius arisanus]|uniref:Enolase-phosphatase E1 n=1 Tax=Fopius arisanus TaxID=64838 RepID=A0A9R1TAH3_9HYME|nr:PREDICTED: enolase-phosphatase E1 [Fopius arisanus]
MAGEKRSQEVEEAQRNENIVVVDIEGTTTSISFVKETLFPYVREHLKDYIEKNWDNAEFKEDLEKLKEQVKKDETDKVEGLVAIISGTPEEEKETLVKNVLWQMDNDRKTGALKQLQGHMWREAYKSGAVKGHVYDDVPKALESWTSASKKIYVYSSGSVEAQKLLFGHSCHGDLLPHFSDYFDTEIGAKVDSSSYKAILSKLSASPSDVIFLTDVAKEAKAASEAGLSSILVIREGNEPLSVEEKSSYPTIQSFLDITFVAPTKRQKLEEIPKKDDEKSEIESKIEGDKKSEKKPEAEPEDVEMTDVSEKKSETETKPKEATPTPEPEAPKAAAEVGEVVDKTPEESPVPEKPSEAPKIEEPEKMEVEKPESKPKEEEKIPAPEEKNPEVDSTKSAPPVDIKSPEKSEETPEPPKSESQTKKIEPETVTKPEPEEAKIEEKIVEKIVEKAVESPEKVPDKTDKPEKSDKPDKTEEKPEEKENGEEVKQNGESKVTIDEKAIEVKAEVNGKDISSKEEKSEEVNEVVKDVTDKDLKDVKEKEEDKGDDKENKEKSEKCEKSEKSEKSEEKKVNGSSETDESHRNRSDTNDTTKNGESSEDKDTIKVKKVVESIVDGAAEPEVVPPVAVVAATS